MLLRVLHAEMLKIKRTTALKMVVIAPGVVTLLMFFMASQAPFSTVARFGSAQQWASLERGNLRFWGMLMMPLYIALQTALLAGLDHAENQWKSLCARPVPRCAMAFVFGGSGNGDRRDADGHLRERRRTTGGRVAAILSVGDSDAGAGAASEPRDHAAG